ncbi:hypothetical protein MASR2M39_07230 [Ignavibacteriales bacterium]
MMKNKILLLAVLFGLVFASCENKVATGNVDEPTMGKKKIAVDETFKPVFEELEKQFESLYPDAHLDIIFAPETKVVELLLQDSVQAIFIARELSEKEKGIIAKKEIKPRNTRVAYDGVAILVNKENKLKDLSQESLKSMFLGKSESFDQLAGGMPNQKFSLVFENPQAGTINYFANRYGNQVLTAKNVFDAKSPKELIDYVSQNSDAIGFLSSIYVYDDVDTTNTTFIKDVKILELQVADSIESEEKSVGPYQYYVAMRYDPSVSDIREAPLYPLVRSIYSINLEGKVGLGQGFAAYVASELGQRTILRFGLVPATMPVRILQIKNENIQIK